jgi:hypothetical protein
VPEKRKTKPKSPPHRDESQDSILRRSRTLLKVRRRGQTNDWELVHPRCALERADDLEEVEKMIAAGEHDVAQDELRWLLNGCSDFVNAHRLLGEMSLTDGDVALARGHFGYAFQVGWSAVPREGLPGPLSYKLPANKGFFEAGKGLAWCLHELGKTSMALEVVRALLKCDPFDPLGLKKWLDEWIVPIEVVKLEVDPAAKPQT